MTREDVEKMSSTQLSRWLAVNVMGWNAVACEMFQKPSGANVSFDPWIDREDLHTLLSRVPETRTVALLRYLWTYWMETDKDSITQEYFTRYCMQADPLTVCRAVVMAMQERPTE